MNPDYGTQCSTHPHCWDYRKDPNFWTKTNELTEVLTKLGKFIPAKGQANDPHLNVFLLIQNAYWDTYNNGTGNSCRWAISKELKASLKKTDWDKEIIEFITKEWSLILGFMSRGRNFGWVLQGCEPQHMFHLEKLMTFVTYHVGKSAIAD